MKEKNVNPHRFPNPLVHLCSIFILKSNPQIALGFSLSHTSTSRFFTNSPLSLQSTTHQTQRCNAASQFLRNFAVTVFSSSENTSELHLIGLCNMIRIQKLISFITSVFSHSLCCCCFGFSLNDVAVSFSRSF